MKMNSQGRRERKSGGLDKWSDKKGSIILNLGDRRYYRRSSPPKIIYLLFMWRLWFVGVLEIYPEVIVVFMGLDSGKLDQMDNTYVFSLKIMSLRYVR